MKAFRLLYHLMRADFLERIRRRSFLVVAGATAYAGYWLVPPLETGYLTVSAAGWRGEYNSAWVGTMFALAIVVFLPLFGFYLVKNAVDRDRQTRTGEILASTPINRFSYVLGKFASNLAVLASILALATFMAAVMQLVRGEDPQLAPLTLAAPIWFIGLPLMALVAALAVLFECLSFLRGGLGNVVYFFLWIAMLPAMFEMKERDAEGLILPYHDPFGVTHTEAAIQRAVREVHPDYDGGFSIGKWEIAEDERPLIRWEGITWTWAIVLGRFLWSSLALLIALLGGLFFDRFDPARSSLQHKRTGFLTRVFQRLSLRGQTPAPAAEIASSQAIASAALTPLAGSPRGRFWSLLLAELRLLLKGHPWWWYAVAGSFVIVGLNQDSAVAAAGILPFAWLWPVLVWSSAGAREVRHATDQLIFSNPKPLRRQLPAAWLAGAVVALAAGSGVGLRLLLDGSWGHLGALLSGALFIPALALALGAWSNTSRLFEIVYLVWWYLAWGGAEALDFMGLSQKALTSDRPAIFLGLALLLFAAAMAGRWYRLRT